MLVKCTSVLLKDAEQRFFNWAIGQFFFFFLREILARGGEHESLGELRAGDSCGQADDEPISLW